MWPRSVNIVFLLLLLQRKFICKLSGVICFVCRPSDRTGRCAKNQLTHVYYIVSFFSDAAVVRGRLGTIGVRGRTPVSRRGGRLRLLDTVRAAGRRLSRVQLQADAFGRRHRRAAHHRRRAARTIAANVVPARSAANVARAVSHARQHKR